MMFFAMGRGGADPDVGVAGTDMTHKGQCVCIHQIESSQYMTAHLDRHI